MPQAETNGFAMSGFDIMVTMLRAAPAISAPLGGAIMPGSESMSATIRLPRPGGRHSRLSEDLRLGAQIWPKGTRIVPEMVLQAANGPAEQLILGRFVCTDGARGRTTSEPMLFSAVALHPGDPVTIASAHVPEKQNGLPNGMLRGTLIETPHGPLEIETLEAGDEVLGRDGSIQIVSWAGRRRFGALELALCPALLPVRIRAGALPGGLPGQDLLLSHEHRLVVADWRAGYLFGEEEILLPAGALLNGRTVHREDPRAGAEYHHLLVSGDGLVCANGLWAETLGCDARNLLAIPEDMRPRAEVHRAAPLPALPHQVPAALAI